MSAPPLSDAELAALAELRGDWRVLEKYREWDTDAWWLDDKIASDNHDSALFTRDVDAQAVAAALNALPRLLAEVRASRASAEEPCWCCTQAVAGPGDYCRDGCACKPLLLGRAPARTP